MPTNEEVGQDGRPKRKAARNVYYGEGGQASGSDLYEPTNGEEESEEVTVETSRSDEMQTNGESATNGDDYSSAPAAASPSSTTINEVEAKFNDISLSSIPGPVDGPGTITVPDVGDSTDAITVPDVGERHVVREKGDGNCLFRALARGFYGHPDRHGEVRKEIVNELCTNVNKYRQFIDDDVVDYLTKMSKNGVWGGEPEIRAFENVHACLVTVVQADGEGGGFIFRKHSDPNVEATDDSTSMENRKVVCVLFSGGMHYDALVPMAETGDWDRKRSTTFVDSMDASAITLDASFSILLEDGERMRLVPRSVGRDASCLFRSLSMLQWNDESRHEDMRLILARTTEDCCLVEDPAFDDVDDADIIAMRNDPTRRNDRGDEVCIRAYVRAFTRPVTVVRVDAHNVVESTKRYDVAHEENAIIAARRENQRVFLRLSPGVEGDHYDALYESLTTLRRRRKRADTSLDASLAARADASAPVKRATGLGLSFLDTSVTVSEMDDDAEIVEAEISDILAASHLEEDDGVYGELDEAQERATGALLARIEDEITYKFLEDAAAYEDKGGDDEDWRDEEDETESKNKVPYKLYFKARKRKRVIKKRKESGRHFAPRAPQNDEETDFLRRAVQGDTYEARRARLALEKITCEDTRSGTGREADYVQKAGGRDALFDFMTSKCPMWNGAILGLAPRKSTETLMHWMQTRDAVLRTLLRDETVAWSKEGRPVLAEEEDAMQSVETTIKIARKIVGAQRKGESEKSISKTLREACPNDFLVSGLCYVWVYRSGSDTEKLLPYVGETVACAKRIGTHLGGVEGAYRRRGQEKVQFAYHTANPHANADIVKHNVQLDQNGKEAEKLEKESRDEGHVASKLLQFVKKRRELLVENAHFTAITSGVFTEDAQRHIMRAYIEHCANERHEDECLEPPTVMDCVRFVGMLKWAREVFDTFMLRTLNAHGACGLNKSIPGEPWRWGQQREIDRAPWTPEQERALVDIFETHSERLRITKCNIESSTKVMVKNAMRGKTGHGRSFEAMLRQLTLMRAEAEKTPEDEFSRRVIDVFNKTIGFSCFEDRWFQMYEALKRFHKKYGHCAVLRSFVTDDVVNAPRPLGSWVNTQRETFRKAQEKKGAKGARGRGHYGHYAEGSDRVRLLNEVGFIWEANDAQWMEGYVQLKLYVEENKHAAVPTLFVTKDGYPLGSWVHTQRREFTDAQKYKGAKGARGARGHYAEGSDRVRLLNEIGFIWNGYDAQWMEGYVQLKLYVEENKHAAVPRLFVTKDGYPLGSWVNTQRTSFKDAQKYKGAKGARGARGHYAEGSDRVRLLNEVGFIWDGHEAQWMAGYVQLKLDINKYGDAAVPKGYVTDDGYPLGSWVQKQRREFKNAQKKKDATGAREKGYYAEGSDRVRHLNEVGFIWEANDAQWMEGFKRRMEKVRLKKNEKKFKTETEKRLKEEQETQKTLE